MAGARLPRDLAGFRSSGGAWGPARGQRKTLMYKYLDAAMLAALPMAAMAEDVCVTAEGEAWKTEAEVQDYAASLGFEVANLKTEDGCYEVYATDTVGTRLEVFFHPVTFQIAMIKLDS
jgi:hypothetical protein